MMARILLNFVIPRNVLWEDIKLFGFVQYDIRANAVKKA
jgi:hypothetical protein